MNYLVIIWLHFLSDFILQPDKIAINKSDNIKYLAFHCIIYSLPFLVFGIIFAFVNCLLHFVVDFITSRITARLWKTNQRHWFFVIIGLDQAIHMSCLVLSVHFLLKY